MPKFEKDMWIADGTAVFCGNEWENGFGREADLQRAVCEQCGYHVYHPQTGEDMCCHRGKRGNVLRNLFERRVCTHNTLPKEELRYLLKEYENSHA
ncbi:hypothetical protein LJC71_09075 [Desulfosarcina sp. OttesenSCG-928-A07]|nr:hypothetical protein [Desulfosarcina sp. OttesenSCG-928-G17]MDL2329876.1 hypothetical protein [Desulfosarcina sp. OttesenSCG-928-A07]